MKKLIVLMVLLIPAWAQTAKVVSLSPSDAARVSAAYADLKAAQEKVDALRSEIAEKYLQVPQNSENRGTCFTGAIFIGTSGEQTVKYWRDGFGCGEWEFSEDFRYVVPKPVTVQSNPYVWNTLTWK